MSCGLQLGVTPGHEALIHSIVLSLQVEDLERLLVDGDPVVGDQGQTILPPEDRGSVPLLGEALHVSLSTNINDLLRWNKI